ncbi:Rtt106-domain-containing protein [Exidia glandulosa HHB12029]|uniref:FACT complex subunit n=1 Tax=Exidia glandulosa HHB12029 TaxID=1314781 RepID=A0A165IXZ1_EXIGL|nr:Rtt106-domain-containing protein [Exidia glandulosa HHB12029]
MADQDNHNNPKDTKASTSQKRRAALPKVQASRGLCELEIHENGLRYLGGNSQKIDILFSNMKHLFFQPCDHELIVLIHIHLKSPIMIGKKKAKDIQFYREASDMQFDETGNRKRKFRYGDEDELELEQQERKRRQALNREFKNFAEKIGESSTKAGDELEAEIPFSDLGFEGVPSRAAVKLYPTFNCLVQLSDPPFLVVTLQDIEIVVLERVQFGLKQFDMVLVFNDYQRQPLQINSIPVSQLDAVKEWLDSVEIPLAESGVNLNWSQIMKTVNEHPLDFFQDGGWSFLTPSGGGAADEKSMSEDSETESEFEAEGEDFEESSSSDAESAFDGSDASEDSGSDFGDGSDGEDWDELERKAAKSDKKRLEASANGKSKDDDSDSDRPKKKAPPKKNGAPAKGKAPPPKGKR